MSGLSEARIRIATWVVGQNRSLALHINANGDPLLFDDIITLLAATNAPEKKKPTLASADRRLKRNDPDTSFEAAVSVTPEGAEKLYRNIMEILSCAGPCTDETLLKLLLGSWECRLTTASGARSRRAELVEAGWVKNTGNKGVTRAGNAAIIWGAVDS